MPRWNVTGAPAAKAFRQNKFKGWYFEVVAIDSEPSAGRQFIQIGLANAAQDLGASPTGSLGATLNASIGFTQHGEIVYTDGGGSHVIDTGDGWLDFHGVGCAAYNPKSERIWFRSEDRTWNGNALADPVQGLYGISTSFITGDIFGAAGLVAERVNELTVNTRAAQFKYRPPYGYIGIGTGFNPAAIGTGTTLSDSNRTLTSDGLAPNGTASCGRLLNPLK